MFGPSEDERTRVTVTLTMLNGERLHGQLLIGLTGKLIDFMNRDQPFLEFEGRDGQIMYLSKASVRSVVAVQLPRTDQLSRRMRDQDVFDPYAVLGLSRGASPDEVRNAYRHRVRAYHPDNFAGIEVPREVLEYVTAMFTRLTAAYRELTERHPVDAE